VLRLSGKLLLHEDRGHEILAKLAGSTAVLDKDLPPVTKTILPLRLKKSLKPCSSDMTITCCASLTFWVIGTESIKKFKLKIMVTIMVIPASARNAFLLRLFV